MSLDRVTTKPHDRLAKALATEMVEVNDLITLKMASALQMDQIVYY